MGRKLILYIGCSLDGYIAKPGDDLGFLNTVDKEGEDYGYTKFRERVDTVIIGRRTFDWVFKEINAVPHPELDTYILTKTSRPAIGKTVFYTGDMKELVERLKNEEGKKEIYCDGGAEIVHELLKLRLIDEIIISIIPMLVGDGIRLFKDGRPEESFELVSCKAYEMGLVQLQYLRK